MKGDRKARKREREKFVKQNVKDLCGTFLRLVNNGVPAEDIRKELLAVLKNKLETDPQNTHLYNEAVRRFSRVVDKGLERTQTEAEIEV